MVGITEGTDCTEHWVWRINNESCNTEKLKVKNQKQKKKQGSIIKRDEQFAHQETVCRCRGHGDTLAVGSAALGILLSTNHWVPFDAKRSVFHKVFPFKATQTQLTFPPQDVISRQARGRHPASIRTSYSAASEFKTQSQRTHEFSPESPKMSIPAGGQPADPWKPHKARKCPDNVCMTLVILNVLMVPPDA